ncbi:MAG: nucleoside-triphosphatase [Marinifilaceae bacterium]
MQEARVFIVTGKKDCGKTQFMENLYSKLKDQGYCISGIFAPKITTLEGKPGYRWVHQPSERTERLADLKPREGWLKQGKFFFSPEAFDVGFSMLQVMDSCMVLLDEVGKLELSGSGWARAIDYLLTRPVVLVLSMRETVVERILDHWNITSLDEFYLPEAKVEKVIQEIILLGEPAKR